GDVRRTSADASLARRDLGWRPRVHLRDGLASQLSWVLGRSAGLHLEAHRRGGLDAAVHDVDHAPGAGALQEAGAEAAPLA
ncbi:MAG TPA: hypothetical protein VHK23_04785, partial [Miltoncostaeaceae bacterium]|nr:hypothetical protein [Miltoncostaeaceae bacterium]